MHADGRKEFNDNVLNSEYQMSKQSFFEKGSVDASEADLIDKFLSNRR